MNTTALYEIFSAYPAVEIDSRKIKQGDIFFALKGPNFNGNLYARQALDNGAQYCICDELSDTKDNRILYVDNVLETMQSLAKYHRQQFDIPFIAITGSNGKTTTKELTHAVLSSQYKCYTTKGNLNNHIGIPLTLLSVKKDAEFAVIEMGANHLHEIAGYCNYVLPTHGLITNCGKAHLEGFGSEEGVRKAKGELYDFIARSGGTIFIDSDYEYLHTMSSGIKSKITYGTSHAQYSGRVKARSSYLEIEMLSGADLPTLKTRLAGAYNLPNILAAVSIGKTFGVPEEMIKKSIEGYEPSNSRSQIIKQGTNTILLDAYNANPASMKAAIENFAAMEGENKIVILGAMMELGNDSINEHRAVSDLLNKYQWQKAAVTGNDYRDLPGNILRFTSTAEAAVWYKQQHFENALILIKGSRGMAMEQILE